MFYFNLENSHLNTNFIEFTLLIQIGHSMVLGSDWLDLILNATLFTRTRNAMPNIGSDGDQYYVN